MYELLLGAEWMRDMPLPGDDPVSHDAKKVFQPKVDHILDVHWAHFREVQEAADRLRQAAREYGHADADVQTAFALARAQFETRS